MSSNVATRALGSLSEDSEIDFTSTAGIERLLKIVRATPMNRNDYNELRDLIFSFKQANNTPDIRANIIERLIQVGIITHANDSTPKSSLAPTQTAAPELESMTPSSASSLQSNKIGLTRPKPHFTSDTFEHVIAAPDVRPHEIHSDVPMETSSVESTSKPIPEPIVKKLPVTLPEAEVAVTDVGDANSIASEVVPLTPQNSVDSVESGITSSLVTEEVGSERALDRIREIKRLVNKKVGNPVHLIDTHNEIGREYMNALLESMKKVSGGSSSELTAAMQRLETAYTSVQSLMAKGGEMPVTDSVVTVEVPTSGVLSESVMPTLDIITPTPESTPTPVSTKQEIEYAALQDTQNSNIQPLVSEVSSKMQSVAKEKQLQDLRKSQVEESQSESIKAQLAAEKIDPLQSQSIENGLKQLLSEWKLFKSSGIFGTGPSGIDHPLYKKMAPQAITAIMSGRFEGVTPEIRQSVNDYMNGWRYEEGILHMQGETFDHYLRRVIQRILERQVKT